jgi:hypothetical protein
LGIPFGAHLVDDVFSQIGFASRRFAVNPEFVVCAVSPRLKRGSLLDPSTGSFRWGYVGRVLMEFVGAQRLEQCGLTAVSGLDIFY